MKLKLAESEQWHVKGTPYLVRKNKVETAHRLYDEFQVYTQDHGWEAFDHEATQYLRRALRHEPPAKGRFVDTIERHVRAYHRANPPNLEPFGPFDQPRRPRWQRAQRLLQELTVKGEDR